MTNMKIYEGAFVNLETNDLNENIQKRFAVRIYDTESVTDNPFGISYRVEQNGDGTQTVFVNWQALPEAAQTAFFGYDDGITNTDTEVGLTGPAVISMPSGDYVYSFMIDYEIGTDPRYQLGEGPVIDLEMGETPLLLSIVDNDEDKFTPIKSTAAEIQIHSSTEIDISLFAEGGDNRFYVEVESEVEGIIFKGFLSISDLKQEFLPDPNIITLTATDGLGFLTDEPLVNFENETPSGIYPIISFLAWALAKTGLYLDLKVCMNIREETAVPLVSDDSGAGHFYTHEYLDAKTFEEEIGVCENCFTVLEKILLDNSFLMQYKGKWVIIRIDEMESAHEYFFTRFNYQGTWIENTEETFIKNIGIDYPMSFMNDDAEVSLVRPYKETIHLFKFEYPEELLCNINFERGEVRVPPDLSAENSEGTYDLECWILQKFLPTGTEIEPAANDTYIVRKFELGYERERYIVMTAAPAAALEGIVAPPISISQGDRIRVSVDWALSENVGSGDGTVSMKMFSILILTDAGDYYYAEKLSDEPAIWQGPMSNQNNTAINHSWNAGDTDESQFENVAVTVPAAPVSGKLYIGLFKEWQGSGLYEADTYYSNLQVDIIPLVNSTYERYTGQEHSVSVDNPKIKAVREQEVFISDAPRSGMKGAILKQGAGQEIYDGIAQFGDIGQFSMDGNLLGSFPLGAIITISGSANNNITATILEVNFSIIGDTTTVFTNGETVTEADADVEISMATFVLAGPFYNAAKLTAGPGSASELMPYGQMQAFDVWNQYNRVMRVFDGTIDKTDSEIQLPGLLHKYRLQDINKNTTDGTNYRLFQLLHYEMDMHLCEWTCFFHEVLKSDIAKTYTGHAFKYVTDE